MDGVEKRVFRRKHALLSTLLEPTPAYLQGLMSQGIMTEEMVSKVKATPEKQKMKTLLTLLESGHSTTLTKIIYMLEQTGFDWVADEIYADLQWEKGKVRIQDYIMQEAMYFSNTLFSDRQFIDLSRKDDLSIIIASRHQVAKEAWQRQVNRKSKKFGGQLQSVQDDVMKIFKEVDQVLVEKEKWRVSDVIKNKFKKGFKKAGQIQSQNLKRVEATPDLEKESKGGESSKSGQVTRQESEPKQGKSVITLLQEKIENLQQLLDNVITEYNTLLDERKRCYNIVGSEPEDGTLEEVLNNLLHQLTRERDQSKESAARNKEKVGSLSNELIIMRNDLTSQISRRTGETSKILYQLKSLEKDLKNAKEDLTDMERKRDILKSQANYWKEKCDILEKTRRLGYYHISKIYEPVPLPHDLPGTRTKPVIYYNPELLEVNDNIVYIKGESKIKPPVSDYQDTESGASHRLPKKGRRALETDSYEPSFKERNAVPRRGQPSIYHAKCVEDLNSNSNNNNSNGIGKGSIKTSKSLSQSTPNLKQTDKLTSRQLRGNYKMKDDTSETFKTTKNTFHQTLPRGQQIGKIILANTGYMTSTLYETSPAEQRRLNILNDPGTSPKAIQETMIKPEWKQVTGPRKEMDEKTNQINYQEQPDRLAKSLNLNYLQSDKTLITSKEASNYSQGVRHKTGSYNSKLSSFSKDSLEYCENTGPTPKEKFDESFSLAGTMGSCNLESSMRSTVSGGSGSVALSASESSSGYVSSWDERGHQAILKKEVKFQHQIKSDDCHGHCQCCTKFGRDKATPK